MNKTFCLSDLHNNYLGLKQVLEASNFDYENDTLISLGDIVDGFSQAYECIEELLKIKNLIPIQGNHDHSFLNFLESGRNYFKWTHGGHGTALSYIKHANKKNKLILRTASNCEGFVTNLESKHIKESHVNFFKNQIPYYIDEEKRLFIHAGFNRTQFIDKQTDHNLYCWDRNLFKDAMIQQALKSELYDINNFKEIFIGHSITINYLDQNGELITKPIIIDKLHNIDTGSGYINGKLTLMNVETKEIFQSDIGKILYPDEHGRG